VKKSGEENLFLSIKEGVGCSKEMGVEKGGKGMGRRSKS
jgi:hypothetical protein